MGEQNILHAVYIGDSMFNMTKYYLGNLTDHIGHNRGQVEL